MARVDPKRGASLAALVVQAFHRDHPLETVPQLAADLGVGIRSLQTLCKMEGTTAKNCLDFIRCLKIVADDNHEWNPRVMLSLHGADSRTIDRLIIVGGLSDEARPSIERFLERQQLLKSRRLCQELQRALIRPV
jgi:hypothetical protein